jgi:hypothetical protein
MGEMGTRGFIPSFSFCINISMKKFKQLLDEAKEIQYSKLSSEQIDKHHTKLTPEEQSRFSDMVDPDKSTPVIIQQRNALQQIHSDRKK